MRCSCFCPSWSLLGFSHGAALSNPSPATCEAPPSPTASPRASLSAQLLFALPILISEVRKPKRDLAVRLRLQSSNACPDTCRKATWFSFKVRYEI